MGIKINGVSIPVGGISWEYTESKKKGIQEMFYCKRQIKQCIEK